MNDLRSNHVADDHFNLSATRQKNGHSGMSLLVTLLCVYCC